MPYTSLTEVDAGSHSLSVAALLPALAAMIAIKVDMIAVLFACSAVGLIHLVGVSPGN